MIEITEKALDLLRERVKSQMSPKRFLHTAAVEKMTERLCELYCPQDMLLMRAAALLHDVTKEKTTEEQVALCRLYGLPVTDGDLLAPKTFHARTAAAMIPREFSEFAHPTIMDAVRWHTTGRADMTLTEKILYLADYIDDTRKFENCVLLRGFFWNAEPQKMDRIGRENLLRDTLILSYRMTVEDLLVEGTPVAIDTIEARNQLLLEVEKQTRNH